MARPFYSAPSSYPRFSAPLSHAASGFRHSSPLPGISVAAGSLGWDHTVFPVGSALTESSVGGHDALFRRQQRPGPRFSCQQCDRHFSRQGALDAHLSEHTTCPHAGCTFAAHRSVVEQHVRLQHETGLAAAIMALNTPEAIAKWRQQRRKNFATVDQAEASRRRRAEQQAAQHARPQPLGRGGRRARGASQPVWKIQQRRERLHERRLRVALADSSEEEEGVVVKTTALPMFPGLTALNNTPGGQGEDTSSTLQSSRENCSYADVSTTNINASDVNSQMSAFLTTQSDQSTLLTTQSNQPTLLTTQSDQPTLLTTQSDQPTLLTTQSDQPTLLTTQSDQPTLLAAQSDQPTLLATQSDQPTLLTTQSDQITLLTTQSDQPTLLTTQPDQPTLLTTQSDQPTLLTTQSDQPTLLTTQSDQPTLLTTQSDQPTLLTTQSDQPTLLTTQSGQPTHTEPQQFTEPVASTPPRKRRRHKRSSTEVTVAGAVQSEVSRGRAVDLAPRRGQPGRRSRPCLLEKLLATDLRREQSVLLQCIRHVVYRDFFRHSRSDVQNSMSSGSRQTDRSCPECKQSNEESDRVSLSTDPEENTTSAINGGALGLLASYNSDSDQDCVE